MQADPQVNEPVPAGTDVDIPTPPPTPKRLLSNGKPAFPLFESLLRESVNKKFPNHPATAPVIDPTIRVYMQTGTNSRTNIRIASQQNRRSQTQRTFEASKPACDFRTEQMAERNLKHEDPQRSEAGNDDENIQPIKLQDPPKPKLKRQLSIDSVERTERERTPKKINVVQELTNAGEQIWSLYADRKPDETDGARSICPVETITPSRSARPASPGHTEHNMPEPMQSPHYFNLKAIELTSPFINPNLRKESKENEDNVFVFPESVEERRSPTKQSPARSYELTGTSTVSAMYHGQRDRVLQRDSFPTDRVHQPEAYYRLEACEPEQAQGKYDTLLQPMGSKYVTDEGFRWPTTATISEPTPFSPRIVTARPKPTCQPTQDTNQPLIQAEEIASLQDRIQLLEREYERAKAIYLPKESSNPQFSSVTKDIQDILRRSALRSISDVDRSPNEKEIRRLEAEVRNKYERSLSDQTYSPRQRQQKFVQQPRQQPSPLGRQRSYIADADVQGTVDNQARLQNKERWYDSPSDVRRQLFSGEDYQSKYDPLPTPTPESVFLEDVQLPPEVAKFFHSKSFHPEDLENLRGILKRSQEQHSLMHTSPGRCSLERYPPVGGNKSTTVSERKFTDSKHSAVMRQRMTAQSGNVFEHGNGREQQRPSLSESQDPYYRHTDAHRSLYSKFEDMKMHFGTKPVIGTFGAEDSKKVEVSKHRRGKIGDINVTISCDSITEKVKQAREILKDLEHPTDTCHCTRIEQEILQMTNEAFARIRRVDNSEESFRRFSKELNDANASVCKSLEILCGIKSMCKYGRTLDEIYSGSVIFRLNCPNLYALEDLWECYKSGELEKLVQNMFVTDELKDRFNADNINLKVTISWDAYKRCKNELELVESGLIYTPIHGQFDPAAFPSASIIHCRSLSEPVVNRSSSVGGQSSYTPIMSPFRERICSDSTVELSPRRAFQEINGGKCAIRLSLSPSKKLSVEGSLDDGRRSPQQSPRRKPQGVKSQFEHENIRPENRMCSDSPELKMSNV